jgi:hypothetical protein
MCFRHGQLTEDRRNELQYWTVPLCTLSMYANDCRIKTQNPRLGFSVAKYSVSTFSSPSKYSIYLLSFLVEF